MADVILEDGTPLTYAGLRKTLQKVAVKRGEWAGLPIPIEGSRLVLESKYPWKELESINAPEEQDDCKLINSWNTATHEVMVVDEGGKRRSYKLPHERFLKRQIDLLGCMPAWSLEAEEQALGKLRSLVPEHIYTMYTLTGAFLETSVRSGVTYVFRRLKPTVALRGENDRMRILAALCMHPIGYYSNTNAGVMVPTDDILAHLLLMRADEHRYWRMCNQHEPLSPQAQC